MRKWTNSVSYHAKFHPDQCILSPTGGEKLLKMHFLKPNFQVWGYFTLPFPNHSHISHAKYTHNLCLHAKFHMSFYFIALDETHTFHHILNFINLV